MFNVLLDSLPQEWEGYPVDMAFETGIKISQCLVDEELDERERLIVALSLMFPEGADINEKKVDEALQWYLNGWNHDNVTTQDKNEVVVMDFDIDQWRIYAAFRAQYGINLNKAKLHFWEYMGLLSNLNECSFTQVVSIRSKKITAKMPAEERNALNKAKEIYRLKRIAHEETVEEKAETDAAVELFNRMRNKSM